MRKLTVNFDGGARPNPGRAGIGVVVRGEDGEVLEERGERIGTATNNIAEYRALLLGIERAAALGAEEVELVGDSQLIVKQVKGENKVKDATLGELHAEVKQALRGFDSWSIRYVPRAENAEADRLVNRVLDGEDLEAPIEPGGGGVAASAPAPTADPGVGPIDPGVDVGHVHLKVADLDRALDFYCGVLGFELQQRLADEAAFISAGGYHHHIGLNTWHSRGGSPPPPGSTGLFHTAIRYPSRRSLADALRRVSEAGMRLTGASDHGVSEALYLDDPDGNGVELYWDRPRAEWPRDPDGGLAMITAPLDLEDLLAELDA
jgi:catechol 2,3-dioxygenase